MSGCCSMRVRIAVSGIGLGVGLVAAVAFLRFQNWHAVAWSAVSGIVAGATLAVHILHHKEVTEQWSSQHFRWIMLGGCLMQLAGVTSLVTYLSLGGVLGQGLTGDAICGNNFWIAAVWGWMTWKWGFQLFYWSRVYYRSYYPVLINEVQPGYHTQIPRLFRSKADDAQPVV